MQAKEFKKIFGNCAKTNGFDFFFGAWFKESVECIFVMDLQKSNYSNSYYLNMKSYVQGSFGHIYAKSKGLIKNGGDVFKRQPKKYEDIFDLELSLTDVERKQKLECFFVEFLNPFSFKVLSRAGIRELLDSNEIQLMPAVKRTLGFEV